MYRSTTTQIRIGGSGGGFNRRFDAALDHIKRGGLPVNPKILGQIRQKLKSGTYKDNRDELLTDLKCDPFLFLYSAKRLHELGTEDIENIVPGKELRILSDEKLIKLFDISESDVSAHRARKTTSVQALRLQHSIISSTSASTMAESCDLQSEEAFSAALFRQLGLNLVSWNYPEQYRQALRSQKSGGGHLEEEIERLIGVAPMAIARKLAAEWRISPVIKRALSSDNGIGVEKKNIASQPQNTPLSLSEICDFSELFAKANDAEYYPNADKEWQNTTPLLNKLFGGEIIQVLNNKVDTSLSLHDEIAQFKPAVITRSQTKTTIESRGKLQQDENLYLKECCAHTKDTFKEVYALIEKDSQVSLNAMKLLVENVLPANGFSRGCLYLLDERELVLNPALRIGDRALTSYSSFKTHQNNLVTASIDSVIPVMQRGTNPDGTNFCQISGALGSSKPQGVLYIEAQPDFFDGNGHDPLLYFHLARVALMDCLGIPQSIWPDKKSKRALLYTGGL